MPWHILSEIKHFAQITTETKNPAKQNAVIMGRTTWLSLPEKYRPLANRKNIVLSRKPQTNLPANAQSANSLSKALKLAARNPEIEKIFVIGGSSVYREAITHPDLESIYFTKIDQNFDCDTFFPKINETKFKKIILAEIQTPEGLNLEFQKLTIKKSKNRY